MTRLRTAAALTLAVAFGSSGHAEFRKAPEELDDLTAYLGALRKHGR